MLELWKMVGAGIISSGLLMTVLGVAAAMTWGRLTDAMDSIRADHKKCEDHTTHCIDELYDGRNDHETRIVILETREDIK